VDHGWALAVADVVEYSAWNCCQRHVQA